MLILNVLLSLAAVIIFAGVGSQLHSSSHSTEQKKTILEESIENLNRNIYELTNDTKLWPELLSRNGSLICVTRYLENSPPPGIPACANGMSGNMNMFWPDGSLFLNGSGQGLRINGQPCAANCDLTIQLRWTIDCDSPCTDPIVNLRTRISFNGSLLDRLVLKTSRLEMNSPIGPNTQNKWALCASRNAVYLPAGFNGSSPDRQGCVEVTAFNGDPGPSGPPGPVGEVTFLTRRDHSALCSGRKTAPIFNGVFAENLEVERLKGGLKLHFFPASGHCTGVALDIVLVGNKGTQIRAPCRPLNASARCFVYGGQTYIDLKHQRNPQFAVTAADLQPFIDNDERVTQIRYDWAYNSGGPGSTCHFSVFNKLAYGYALVVESNYDNKPTMPPGCIPTSPPWINLPSIFN